MYHNDFRLPVFCSAIRFTFGMADANRVTRKRAANQLKRTGADHGAWLDKPDETTIYQGRTAESNHKAHGDRRGPRIKGNVPFR